MRKEQREEKARRVRERKELLTSEVGFKALSQDGKKKQKGFNKDINQKEKRKKKEEFGEKAKPKNVTVNQRRNNLFIVSFLLPLRCLFS